MTVFNDDCVKVMDNFKELCPYGGVDLTIISPSYDNLRNYNGSSIWNFEIFKMVAQGL